MELTLALSPDDAARLGRLPCVRDARAGRSRGQTTRIVWHDTLDRALAADGLALAEQRGGWQLERHRPQPTEPWPPATDHHLIEEAGRIEALAHRPPAGLTAVAAFEGRRTLMPLTVETEPVSLTLLQGVVRAVAAERPCARLAILGPPMQTRALALSLGETLSLDVPAHSLAMEALALADGAPPTDRRGGAPTLPAEGMTVAGAFAHIVGHLADVIATQAPGAADIAADPEFIHQMRVAVRRVRSAFALFPAMPENPAWRNASDGLRQLGHMLGPARDWDVFMTETLPPVEQSMPEQAALAALRRAGERRRRAARETLSGWLRGPAFRTLCLELACLAAADPLEPDPVQPGLREFAAAALRRRWRKLVNAGRVLEELDDAALHGLRLKAKRLRYAAEFFAPLFADRPAHRFIRRLSVLQDRLGLFNDTSVAAALLRDLGERPGFGAGLVLGFTAARGVRARPKIAAAWARFRRREPFWE